MEDEYEEDIYDEPEKFDPESEGAVVCFECGYRSYDPGYKHELWECSRCRRR